MRALPIALLLGVFTVSIADAAPKRKVAVLGTRPVDEKANDRETALVSEQLTVALRAAAGDALVPTDKSFAELSTKYKCDSESPACIAAIGIDLGADLVIFGRVERRDDFRISLKLLDIRSKHVDRAVGRTIRHKDANEAEIKTEAVEMYAKLVPPAP